MKEIKFNSDVYLLGDWIESDLSITDDIAYYLYLKDVKKEQDSGKWLTYESTFILDQHYFLTTKTNEKYYNKSKNIIRRRKLKQIKNNNING